MKRILSSGALLVLLTAACSGDDEAEPRADGAAIVDIDAGIPDAYNIAFNDRWESQPDAQVIDAAASDAPSD